MPDQSSLTAGTVLDSTKLPLRTWFLAIHLISQHKTGLSSLALMRHLGTRYRTAWLVHHKLMAAMAARDALEPLAGNVQLDDAYLGAEHPGVGGRGSPNKVITARGCKPQYMPATEAVTKACGEGSVTAEGVTCSAKAARSKLPSRMTAAKAVSAA